MITFTDWLRAQRDRRDAVGRLAAMAEDAPEWPTEADCGLGDYYDYLEMEGASEQTLRALDTAFREYTFLDALAEAEYEAA